MKVTSLLYVAGGLATHRNISTSSPSVFSCLCNALVLHLFGHCCLRRTHTLHDNHCLMGFCFTETSPNKQTASVHSERICINLPHEATDVQVCAVS